MSYFVSTVYVYIYSYYIDPTDYSDGTGKKRRRRRGHRRRRRGHRRGQRSQQRRNIPSFHNAPNAAVTDSAVTYDGK